MRANVLYFIGNDDRLHGVKVNKNKEDADLIKTLGSRGAKYGIIPERIGRLPLDECCTFKRVGNYEPEEAIKLMSRVLDLIDEEGIINGI